MIRLVCTSNGARKFWEGSVKGRALTVRFGKLGTRGQVNTSEFDSKRDAEVKLDRLVREKLRKGYFEEQQTSAGGKTEERYPFLFFGAQPADWYEALNFGHTYELRFATAPDAGAKKAIADAFESGVFDSVVNSPRDPWLWSQAWTVFSLGEKGQASDAGETIFPTVQSTFRAIHSVCPLIEANYINVRELGSDPWTVWSLARQPEGPAPHPRTIYQRGHFGKREDSSAPLPRADKAFEAARAAAKQRLIRDHEAAFAADQAVEPAQGEGITAVVVDAIPDPSGGHAAKLPKRLAAYLKQFGWHQVSTVGDGRYLGQVRYDDYDDRFYVWHASMAQPLELLRGGSFSYQAHADGTRAIVADTKHGHLYEVDLIAGGATYICSWKAIHWNAVAYTVDDSVVVAAESMRSHETGRSCLYLLARRPPAGEAALRTKAPLEVVDEIECEPGYPSGLTVMAGIIAVAEGNEVRIFATDGLHLKNLWSIPFANEPYPCVCDDRLFVRGASRAYEVKGIREAYAAAFAGAGAEGTRRRKGGKKALTLTPVAREMMPVACGLHTAIRAQLADGDVPVAVDEDKAFIFRPAKRGWSLHFANAESIRLIAKAQSPLTGRQDRTAPPMSAADAAQQSSVRLHPGADRAFFTEPERVEVYEVTLPGGPAIERMSYSWGYGSAKDAWHLNDACFVATTTEAFFFMERGTGDPLLTERLNDGELACTPDRTLVFIAGSGKQSAVMVYGVRGKNILKLHEFSAGINPRFRVGSSSIYIDCMDNCFVLQGFELFDELYQKAFGVQRSAKLRKSNGRRH
jgi:predicted DNA-binding WGR domain protein